jgi:hypothetical protein
MKIVQLAIVIAFVVLTGACKSATAPDDVPPGAIRVTGTVLFYTLEGGFWAVRGDDGTTYDPANGLPKEFQQVNLRVSVLMKIRADAASFHMVGPVVDIIEIRKL